MSTRIERRDYADNTSLTVEFPWGAYRGGRALCPDGKVRALARIASTADTFFSVPAAVKAKGKTVSGYVTVTTRTGSSVPTDDDPEIVKFIPYTYGANAKVFTAASEP